ncbi:MAG: CerR family C-terminal domain-containing protein [Desulfohalobiaceae bacterium]
MPEAAGTRRRILDQARGVFVERGFEAATIREICRRAKANVAAVNYYFSSKEELYLAVIEDLMDSSLERFPPLLGLGLDAPAEERLRAFVTSFLLRIVRGSDGPDQERQGQLIARELTTPSPKLERLVNRYARPLKALLESIVSELLGPEAPRDAVRLCAYSVASQCLYALYGRAMDALLDPGEGSLESRVDILAEHIVAFSLAGIQAAGTQPDAASPIRNHGGAHPLLPHKE